MSITQHDLFITPKQARRRDAAKARRLKMNGLAAVSGPNAVFLSECRGFARQWAHDHGSVTIEDVRRWAIARALQPTHPNAWGAVFNAAHWREVGHDNNAVPSAHSRRVIRWALPVD